MPKSDRMKFAEYLDKMATAFWVAAVKEGHRQEVSEFITALDEAKRLLAKVAGKEEDNHEANYR